MKEFWTNFLAPTKTIYSMWVIMAAIVIVCIILTRGLKLIPGKKQNVAEMIVDYLCGYYEDILGRERTRKYFPMLATFFVFIIVCNYCGLIPGAGELFTVPTSVLSVTCGLSIIAFLMIQVLGVKTKGLGGHLKSFAKPVALLFPIMVLEQVVRPVSMALRLYGNIYGEELAADTLFGLFPIGLPIVMHILSLLFCFIQAMVFTMLLAVFISEATEIEE